MNGSFGSRVRAAWSALAPGRATPAQPAAPSDLLDQASAAAAAGPATVAPGSTAAGQPELVRQELQAALSRIFTSASDAILTVDAGGRIMMFNHAAEQLLGSRAGAALGQPISRFCPAPLTEPGNGQAQASGRTIRMTAELGQTPPIGGRAGELREAPANLIINAVDAMPDGGTLTLRTRMDENMVAVEVADTGTGMPPEVRERIFDPFYTTKGDRGTGLGLPMVQGIVQQHHGEISVVSELGQGTIFTVRFQPLAVIQEATAAPARPERPRVRGLRVLLAEDEPSLRQILTSYLRVDGHAIEAAANGEDALAKYRPEAFDLIITDRAMPEMGGDQLAAELERRGHTSPVIMPTGLGDLMNEVGERPPGVNLVVAKPVTLAKLRAAVVLVTTEAPWPAPLA